MANDIYGWQVFDENGNVIYDHTVIMSRKLGSYDIPLMQITASNIKWSHRIADIAFEGGTPFCHITMINSIYTAPTTTTSRYMFIHPQLVVGSNYIDISYNDRLASFPDDVGGILYMGGMRVHYGVYNA